MSAHRRCCKRKESAYTSRTAYHRTDKHFQVLLCPAPLPPGQIHYCQFFIPFNKPQVVCKMCHRLFAPKTYTDADESKHKSRSQ